MYVSTVGGARVSDPAADLAAALAVASAACNKPVPPRHRGTWARLAWPANCAAYREPDRRLSEAARLGSAEAVVPAEAGDSREQIMKVHAGMVVHSVATVEQALAALSL